MNWEFIGKYLPLYERAAVLTVKIGLIGIAFAILVGLQFNIIKYRSQDRLWQSMWRSAEIHRFWYSYSLFIMVFRRSGSD